MGIISDIIESNRRRNRAIAEIQESTQKEIKKITEFYEEKEKRLQERHDKFMKMVDDPNISGNQVLDLISEYFKEEEEN